jgi:hypothetical protein
MTIGCSGRQQDKEDEACIAGADLEVQKSSERSVAEGTSAPPFGGAATGENALAQIEIITAGRAR